MRASWVLVLLVSVLPVSMGADLACAVDPAPDTIVVQPVVSVKGLAFDAALAPVDGAQVVLNVNGVDTPFAEVTAGSFVVPNVALPVGISFISGSTVRSTPGAGVEAATIAPFMVERRVDLVARGRQEVFLDFLDPNFDPIIARMALATLDPPPAPEALPAFIEGVKNRIREFFMLAYFGNDVVLVNALGPGVHRVNFDSTTSMPGLLGRSPLDFTNLFKMQTSTVFMTTFEMVVVTQARLLLETPARPTDTVEQRIADLGTLIGRTAAHELGHSLGLVPEGESLLKGCLGSHNCPDYDVANPLANRFEAGHFIMDPGEQARLFARAGFSNRTTREARLPVFNSYNKSYLGHID